MQLPTPYQEFIFKSRYARWIDKENRRENWDEAVDRYFNFMLEYLDTQHGYKPDALQVEDIKKAVLNLDILPSLRALMTAGPALKRDHVCSYNCCYLPISDLKCFDECLVILMSGTGVGFSVEHKYIDKLPIVSEHFENSNTTIVVEDSKSGWGRALRELLAMLWAGQIPKWDLSNLRPAGAKLKIMGGRSSGPEPLNDLFNFCVRTITNAKGRRLTSLECHDIVCKIAEIVVVGGVRRCLPSYAKVHTKHGIVDIIDVNVGDEVLTTQGYKKVTNKFDQGVQELVRVTTQDSSFKCTPNHKVAVLTGFDEYKWVAASQLSPGDRLIAPSFSIEGQDVRLPDFHYDKPKHSTTCKNIVIPELDEDVAWLLGLIQGDGYVRLTSKAGEVNIPIAKTEQAIGDRAKNTLVKFGVSVTRMDYENYYVLKAKSKQLATYFHGWFKQPKTPLVVPKFMWAAPKNIRMAFICGLMDADGSTKTRPVQIVCSVYENYIDQIRLLLSSCGIQARKKALSTSNLKSNWQPKFAVVLVNKTAKQHLNNGCGRKKINISGVKEQYSNTFPGAFSKKNIDVSWSNTKHNLIPVKVVSVEKSTGYQTWDIEVEDVHEFFCDGYLMHNSALISLSDLTDNYLQTAKSGNWWMTHPHRALANNSAVYSNGVPMDLFMDEWKALYQSGSGERGIVNRDAMKNIVAAIGRRDKDHDFGCNPCSEIILRPFEFCNLTTVICRPEDTLQTLLNKIDMATILGTWQSTLTNFKYIRKKYKENCEEERLLGVSLNGIQDSFLGKENNHVVENALKELKYRAVLVNRVLSKEIGINPSVAITCVKPEGTSSQLVNSASGIHARYAEYYIRRVRQDNKDPLTQFMKDMGVPNEPCVNSPNNVTVFSFPIKGPVTMQRNAVETLEQWKLFQLNYTEHKPSITVTIKSHEWLDVAAWVYKNMDIMSGVSFLPDPSEGGVVYKQMPYEEITKEEYERLESIMPKSIDWSKLSEYEKEDTTTSAREFACVGDVCEVVGSAEK